MNRLATILSAVQMQSLNALTLEDRELIERRLVELADERWRRRSLMVGHYHTTEEEKTLWWEIGQLAVAKTYLESLVRQES